MLLPRGPRPDHNVSELADALPPELCEDFVRLAWEARSLWTKFSISACLGYFGFGGSLNFDADRGSMDLVPFWSLKYGFGGFVGPQESDFVLGVSGAQHRAGARDAQAASLPTQAIRRSIALRLGVDENRVVLGGEGVISNLSPPCVQVWLPHVVWSFLVNPHMDTKYAHAVKLRNCNRSSTTTLLWPLRAPPGSGLLFWTRSASGAAIEHEVLYQRGSLYSFPADLPHALRPWPYREDLLAPRVTLQAFALECAGLWLIYH